MTIDALRSRLAEIYNVEPPKVLPVRGVLHAIELSMRVVAREGERMLDYEASADLDRLAAIYGLTRSADAGAMIRRFDAAARDASLAIIDESGIEFSGRASAVGSGGNVVVIRNLEGVYLNAGAPCAALIASAPLLNRFASVIEPNAVPPILAEAVLDALAPYRLATTRARIDRIKSERKRLAEGLTSSPEIASAREDECAFVRVLPKDEAAFVAALRAFRVDATRMADGAFLTPVGEPAENERLLAAFAVAGPTSRVGEAVRETLETRISAIVDLDREGAIEIATGVGFFDHMLTQIVHHAGVSATIACDGDLDVDAHHTIEDCAIAFGQALSRALGERRGVARFGFVLPMDEAEAKVSVDLGGRPFLVFEGAFKAPLLGEYPTEMTAHVFRSLSQSLGASIHVSVAGENDHHKTEACYKAFGRALRQALRVEGSATPSTKGVL